MCGRFSQAESSSRLAAIFGAELDDDLPDGKYNVAPTDHMCVVLDDHGGRVVTGAEWGFRPFWRDRAEVSQPGWINAKAETALESPAFGRALRQQRCVIPADAFYEWDRGHRPPQPYAIGPAADEGVLALGGVWTSRNGEVITAAILTTGPNRLMAAVHHRMPVIIPIVDIDTWLDPDAPILLIESLLVAAPDDALRVWPVSTAVNSVRNGGPDLLHEIDGAPSTVGLAQGC